MSITLESLGLKDIPKELIVSFQIQPLVALMQGAGFGLVFFNTVLVTAALTQQLSKPKTRTLKSWLTLVSFILVVTSTAWTYFIACTGKEFMKIGQDLCFNVTACVMALYLLTSMPNLKFFAVIVDPIKRMNSVQMMWMVNAAIASVCIYFGVASALKNPPDFTGDWYYITVVLAVEPLILGVFFFSWKLVSMTRIVQGTSSDRIKIVGSVTNIFTMISIVLNSGLSACLIKADGALLAPLINIFMNLILMNEVLADQFSKKLVQMVQSNRQKSSNNNNIIAKANKKTVSQSSNASLLLSPLSVAK